MTPSTPASTPTAEREVPAFNVQCAIDVLWNSQLFTFADMKVFEARLAATPPAIPDRNLEGAGEFVTALMLGQPIWPNAWGQDVAAAAFFLTDNGKRSTALSTPAAVELGEPALVWACSACGHNCSFACNQCWKCGAERTPPEAAVEVFKNVDGKCNCALYPDGRLDPCAECDTVPAAVEVSEPQGLDIDPKETVGQLAERVGAWETPEGYVSFGSWMALSAFHTYTLANAAKQWKQMEGTRAALATPPEAAASVQPFDQRPLDERAAMIAAELDERAEQLTRYTNDPTDGLLASGASIIDELLVAISEAAASVQGPSEEAEIEAMIAAEVTDEGFPLNPAFRATPAAATEPTGLEGWVSDCYRNEDGTWTAHIALTEQWPTRTKVRRL